MMVSSFRKIVLVGFIVACVLPWIQSLSIIPSTKTVDIKGDPFDNDVTTAVTSATGTTENENDGIDTTTDPTFFMEEIPHKKLRPVLEVVEIVQTPFKPPSILILDFFQKSNSTGNSDEDSKQSSSSESGQLSNNNNGNETASSKKSKNLDNDDSSSSEETDRAAEIGILEIPPEDDNTTSSLANISSTATTEHSSNAGLTDRSKRIKRDTIQTSNNSSQKDTTTKTARFLTTADEDSTSTLRSNNLGNDDNSLNGDSSNDDDGDNDNASGGTGANKTDASKTGTVKIFLEILQLVPIPNSDSNSTESSTSMDAGSSTTDVTATPKSVDRKTVSNQKQRVARSVTGSPSISVKAPALALSTVTSKPLTGKNAPAVILPSVPSTNAPVVKASVAHDDDEGPPLTVWPQGKADNSD